MKEIFQKIHETCLEDLMSSSFANYSKFIIQDRAIPDVRDGLKPVQRRILYVMYKNHNTIDKPYIKAAKTVGDTIGSFHPHGDSSIYEAMVRMSQDWKSRYPNIDFKGNNGSMDGDPAAAYRYTETRLAKISNELLKDIEKNTVIMAPTFDDKLLEPTVLPARYPVLLVNGTTGISAGYATNIPPHNLGEVIDATIFRLDKPNSSLEDIMQIIKGPDFPTGGTIYGSEGLKNAYETGKGRILVRASYEIQTVKGKTSIIISEIPYEVNKQALVYKINEIRIDKKIDGIAEVRDESDINGLKITIELKSEAKPTPIINYLLKNTELQASYNFNMVAIVKRRPKQLGLLAILDAYIEHQREVVQNRTKFDLKAKEKECHILEGLIKALSILGEIIQTIRKSQNKADAKQNLIKEYDFTEVQAEYIVTLQLYKLTKTDITETSERLDVLHKEIAVLKSILENESVLLKVVKHELKNVKKEFELPRKTCLSDENAEIKIDVMEIVSKEKVIVVLTKEGYIKKVSLKSYQENEETLLKPNDYLLGLYELLSTSVLIVWTNFGNYLYLPVWTIPETKWKELGKHISNLVPLNTEEKIVAVNVLTDLTKEFLLWTKLGFMKSVKAEDLVVRRWTKPMTAFKLKNGDELINANIKKKETLFVTNNNYYLRFNIETITATGLKAGGIKGINLKEDYVVNAFSFDDEDDYLAITTNNKTGKRIKLLDLDCSSRGKKGSGLLKKIKSFNYQTISAQLISSKDELGLVCGEDIVKIKASDIPIMDLSSTGHQLAKKSIQGTFKVCEKEKFSLETIKEEIDKEPIKKEMTISDFIDDFKI